MSRCLCTVYLYVMLQEFCLRFDSSARGPYSVHNISQHCVHCACNKVYLRCKSHDHIHCRAAHSHSKLTISGRPTTWGYIPLPLCYLHTHNRSSTVWQHCLNHDKQVVCGPVAYTSIFLSFPDLDTRVDRLQNQLPRRNTTVASQGTSGHDVRER